MKLDYIKYALDNVKNRKMRSWLTVLSILIGIMAIFALISFGQGLSVYIDSLSEQMGTDKLMIYAKGFGAIGMDENFFVTKEELDFIGKLRGMNEIAGMYAKTVEVEYEEERKYVFAAGWSQGSEKRMVEEMFGNIEIIKGRNLKKGDKLKAVLGYNYQLPNKVFKKAVKLDDTIEVNGYDVEVIGFYGAVGNPQDDSNVYFTDEAMEFLFPDTVDKYQYAIARVNANENATLVAERATEKFRKFKDQEEGQEDFYIQTFEQVIETFNTIMAVINGVLVLIALISLFVAGVNIMNTMYTAVLERTKEIGVMKAIGAKNLDIMFMFLIESGVLGLVGGALGILVGFVIAKIGEAIAAGAGYSMLQPIFPLWLILGCMAFAFFVGALAGLLPSIQASRLQPVEALRYE